ncbi:MAG: hypothetical protein E7A84_00095 [Streptococcus oralis]|nr:hypothetical protein [Streptococcus oralis]
MKQCIGFGLDSFVNKSMCHLGTGLGFRSQASKSRSEEMKGLT